VRLEGKVALITGAAGGMGKVAAQLFAAEGAKVVVSDVSDQAGEATVVEIAGGGGAAAYVHADVSRGADAERMVAFAMDRFGHLDVLYNNAGIFHPQDDSVVNTPEDIWNRTIDINLKGVFLSCQYGIPAMLASGGGSIINVASFVALMGAAAPQIAYTASKGGVLAMTREIAVEFARQGIRANALCPGPIETPLLADLLADPERRNRRLVHIPIGRFGKAEEVARAALFLASDDSSLMTGAALVVDGGITAAYLTPE
jgi:NAD(P)-dependent dehydrogenase (short-subunit alcohol dehydrogenase family)